MRDELLICNKSFWQSSADSSQHILWKRYWSFWEVPYMQSTSPICQASCTPCTGNTLFVGFLVCIYSKGIRTMLKVTTITGDSVSAGMFDFSTPQIMECQFSSGQDSLCFSKFDFWDRSLSLFRLVSVCSVLAVCFGQWETFLTCRSPCILWWVKCELQSFPQHRTNMSL